MTANERRPAPEAGGSSAIQPVVRRWRPGPGGTVLVMSGPVARDAIPAMCERALRLLLGCDAGPVTCDVGRLAEPDATTIDALARLQLTARRIGRRVELRSACEELEDLLTLTGLLGVLEVADGRIIGISFFLDTERLFPQFGLPPRLDG